MPGLVSILVGIAVKRGASYTNPGTFTSMPDPDLERDWERRVAAYYAKIKKQTIIN